MGTTDSVQIWTLVIAIIGALAWLPSIVQWLRDLLKKVKLTIISGKQFDVGFTTFGPIINLNLAFLSEYKKALIRQIDLELVHESHGVQNFSWQWFEETLYATDIPNSGLISTKKNQNAIAIKIGIDELIEKIVGFQQNTFKSEYNKHFQKLVDDAIAYSQSKKNLGDLMVTDSYRELSELFKKYFNWKTGRYHVKIITHISNENVIVEHEFDFSLTSLDIKLLQDNVERCQKILEQTFVDSTIDTGKNWLWVTTNKR